MSNILPFTGTHQAKAAPTPFYVPPIIPEFLAGQSVWIIDHENDRRCVGEVFRQSGEWVQVRIKGHQPVAVHVSALEAMEPEVA